MLHSLELHNLASLYNLPKRQLSEAQEVLLYHGLEPAKIRETIQHLCQSANAQGGGVAIFDKLLKGQIASLRVSRR